MSAPQLYPDLFGGETPICDDERLTREEQLELPIETQHRQRGHRCTVCHINPVAPTDGQDTCNACAVTI